MFIKSQDKHDKGDNCSVNIWITNIWIQHLWTQHKANKFKWYEQQLRMDVQLVKADTPSLTQLKSSTTQQFSSSWYHVSASYVDSVFFFPRSFCHIGHRCMASPKAGHAGSVIQVVATRMESCCGTNIYVQQDPAWTSLHTSHIHKYALLQVKETKQHIQ